MIVVQASLMRFGCVVGVIFEPQKNFVDTWYLLKTFQFIFGRADVVHKIVPADFININNFYAS